MLPSLSQACARNADCHVCASHGGGCGFSWRQLRATGSRGLPKLGIRLGDGCSFLSVLHASTSPFFVSTILFIPPSLIVLKLDTSPTTRLSNLFNPVGLPLSYVRSQSVHAGKSTSTMSELRFDGQTVVVTGAGGGLGKAYALFFASRGANVVVNDLGGSFKGEGAGTRVSFPCRSRIGMCPDYRSQAADVVVNEIKAAGGKAAANYDSVENGDKIIETAIQAFGRIDVLINNAGILRDISFKNMKDDDWDLIIKVHVKGAYKCARAAWPHFRKQKYGRIINTASAAGLFGSFGQCNYSAAKLSQVGFTETLAKEGVKYNILCNVIAPIAASRMTATVMPPDVLENLKPEWVVPLVAVLVHPSNKHETGSIFEVGGGHVAKIRWERAKGALLKCDDTLTPGAVLKKWNNVNDFSEPEYPSGVADMMGLLEQSMKMGPNDPGEKLDFTGKVALVTGGGAG
jgi:multifunctional beta-oxidation protein